MTRRKVRDLRARVEEAEAQLEAMAYQLEGSDQRVAAALRQLTGQHDADFVRDESGRWSMDIPRPRLNSGSPKITYTPTMLSAWTSTYTTAGPGTGTA